MSNDYLKGVNRAYSYREPTFGASPIERAGYENAKRHRDAWQQNRHRPSAGGGGGTPIEVPTPVKVTTILGVIIGALAFLITAFGMEGSNGAFGISVATVIGAIGGGFAGFILGWVLMIGIAIARIERRWAKALAIIAVVFVALVAVIIFTGGW